MNNEYWEAPDSERTPTQWARVPEQLQREPVRQVNFTRIRLKRIVGPTAVGVLAGAAVLAGPNIRGAVTESNRQQIQATVRAAEKQPIPQELIAAQGLVVANHFGIGKVDKVHAAANRVEEYVNYRGQYNTPGAWRMDVSNIVDPSKVEVDENNRYFVVDGKKISMASLGSKKQGETYIVAGQEVDGNMHSGVVVGFDQWEPDESAKESFASAISDARKNLGIVLTPKEERMLGFNDISQR